MRSVALVLSFSLLTGAAYAQSGMPNYSTIWNIGDSLSDTGRTYARTTSLANGTLIFSPLGGFLGRDKIAKPVGSLYDNGRFSNGKVWAEYLNTSNGITYNQDRNLAWGGAVAGTHETWVFRQVIPTIADELGTFRNLVGSRTERSCSFLVFGCETYQVNGAPLGSNPLVTYWIGGNDFRQEIEDASTPNLKRALDAVTGGITPALLSLNEAIRSRSDTVNTKTTFYVGTVPDVSTTPKGTTLLTAAKQAELGAVIQGTNRAIKQKVYDLEALFTEQNARLVVFDAAALLAEVQRNPGSFGFKNATQNCVNADDGKYVNGCNGTNVTDFLFWDQFHPTTKAHEMIAQYAQTTDRLEFGASASLDKPYVANIELRNRTFAGPISGSGLLIKQGEMVLTLGGNNSYTGGTRIDGGLVQISSDANLGARQGALTLQGGGIKASESFVMSRDVRVDASVPYGQLGVSKFGGTFVVDPGKALTLQGNTLSGSGDIYKDGAGILDLRSTVRDARKLTEVNEGLLKVNTTGEYRTTILQVNQKGMLGGSGTIIGRVNNAGRIEPGNSIGTLTIVGDLVQEDGGAYHLEVDTDRADNLVVTGSVQLDGDVNIVTDATDKITTQSFTFLRSDNPLQGQYDQAIDLSPFLSETLSYASNTATVSFNRNFAAPAVTANQQALASHLNGAYRTVAQGDLDNVFYALDNTVTNEAGANALEQLSGQSIGNLLAADAIQRGQFTRALEDRMAARRAGRGGDDLDNAAILPLETGRSAVGGALQDATSMRARTPVAPVASGDGISAWARVLGGPADIRGPGSFDMNGVGVLVGLDKGFGSGLVGVSLGYGNFESKGRNGGNGEADTYQASLYGSLQSGNLFVDGTVGYAHSDYSTNRRLSFGGLSRVAAGSADGDDFTLSLKAGAVFAFSGFTAEPSLGFDWYHLNRSGFTETLAGSAGLQVASQTVDLVLPSVGLRVGTTFDLGNFKLSPELSARYYYNFGDTKVDTTAGLIGAPALPFKVETTGLGHSIGVISAGLTAQHGEHLKLFGRYDLTVANNVTAHTFSAGLKYTW